MARSGPMPDPDSAISRFSPYFIRRPATMVHGNFFADLVGGTLIRVNGLKGWLDDHSSERRCDKPFVVIFGYGAL